MNVKKILAAVSAVILTVALACIMTGCYKSGSIVKAFEAKEYTVTEISTDNDTAKSILKTAGLTDEQVKNASEYKIYLCTAKGLASLTSSGVVIKFPSGSALKDFLTVEDKDGNKDSSAYDKAKENGSVNGNCLYFGAPAGKEIFEKA